MIIFTLDALSDDRHIRHILNPDDHRDICQYSNYRIINGQSVVDEDFKAKWRYKDTGKPFNHGLEAYCKLADQNKPIKSVCELYVHLVSRNQRVQIWCSIPLTYKKQIKFWIDSNLYVSGRDPYEEDIPLKMGNFPAHFSDAYIKKSLLYEWENLPKMDVPSWMNANKIEMVFEHTGKQESIEMFKSKGINVFEVHA